MADTADSKSLEGHDISQLLEELVQAGEIIEVEYILPYMDYRLKSFYLPRGSEVKVKNA